MNPRRWVGATTANWFTISPLWHISGDHRSWGAVEVWTREVHRTVFPVPGPGAGNTG